MFLQPVDNILFYLHDNYTLFNADKIKDNCKMYLYHKANINNNDLHK